MLLKEPVLKKEAEPKHLAYLTDRILTHENKKQIYGTQFRRKADGSLEPFPIKDRKKMVVLRRAAGIESLSENLRKLKKITK